MKKFERTIALRMPPNHNPVIQRYSARLPSGISTIASTYFGVQARNPADIEASDFVPWLRSVLMAANAPDACDFARYDDRWGFRNLLCAAYWLEWEAFYQWHRQPAVRQWWDSSERTREKTGYWIEALRVPVERIETILFPSYRAGLARCSGIDLEPIQESGYFGAMRDRIPIAAIDPLEPPVAELSPFTERDTAFARWQVNIPPNLVSIRSGVRWARCGAEQMQAYEEKLRPALDGGMEYLRTHARETGCCSLRQVRIVDGHGAEAMEGYSHGYFLSLGHLERWAHHHETHLAIYWQAMADRKKYLDRLELGTFHEVFVLDPTGHIFEYVNCHPGTGLLPFFEARRS